MASAMRNDGPSSEMAESNTPATGDKGGLRILRNPKMVSPARNTPCKEPSTTSLTGADFGAAKK